MSLFGYTGKQYLLLLIILFYFLLRLPNLTLQPIFADEAIYIRWAQIAKAEESLRFISLQDGKTPLFIWAMAPFLMLFEDPLFAGRLLSVIAGLFTLLGVYKIGQRFFNQRVGLIGATLVAITPFMIFFDRMALVDSMLTAFTVWSVYFGLKLADKPSLKTAIILGILLGGGWLTKTPGMVNIVLLPLLLLRFEFKKGGLKKRSLKLGGLLSISAVIALAIYLFQKIDPNFYQLSARNNDYIHPLSRLLQYPFDPLWVHLIDTYNFAVPFLGPVLFFIPLVILMSILKRDKTIILILAWAMIPFVYELQFIKAYTARYILFSIPLMLLLTAWAVDIILSQRKLVKYFGVLMIFLTIIWSAFFSINLLTQIENTPLSRNDRQGYLEDWTAGYGLKEIANYLIDRSQDEVIVVGTEGSFGTLPDGLLIYLDRYFHSRPTQQIIVLGGKALISDTLRNLAYEKPTFFIANKSRYFNPGPGIELIKEFPKVVGPSMTQGAILLFRLTPGYTNTTSKDIKR